MGKGKSSRKVDVTWRTTLAWHTDSTSLRPLLDSARRWVQWVKLSGPGGTTHRLVCCTLALCLELMTLSGHATEVCLARECVTIYISHVEKLRFVTGVSPALWTTKLTLSASEIHELTADAEVPPRFPSVQGDPAIELGLGPRPSTCQLLLSPRVVGSSSLYSYYLVFFQGSGPVSLTLVSSKNRLPPSSAGLAVPLLIGALRCARSVILELGMLHELSLCLFSWPPSLRGPWGEGLHLLLWHPPGAQQKSAEGGYPVRVNSE